jgi:hypothetical protein
MRPDARRFAAGKFVGYTAAERRVGLGPTDFQAAFTPATVPSTPGGQFRVRTRPKKLGAKSYRFEFRPVKSDFESDVRKWLIAHSRQLRACRHSRLMRIRLVLAVVECRSAIRRERTYVLAHLVRQPTVTPERFAVDDID